MPPKKAKSKTKKNAVRKKKASENSNNLIESLVLQQKKTLTKKGNRKNKSVNPLAISSTAPETFYKVDPPKKRNKNTVLMPCDEEGKCLYTRQGKCRKPSGWNELRKSMQGHSLEEVRTAYNERKKDPKKMARWACKTVTQRGANLVDFELEEQPKMQYSKAFNPFLVRARIIRDIKKKMGNEKWKMTRLSQYKEVFRCVRRYLTVANLNKRGASFQIKTYENRNVNFNKKSPVKVYQVLSKYKNQKLKRYVIEINKYYLKNLDTSQTYESSGLFHFKPFKMQYGNENPREQRMPYMKLSKIGLTVCLMSQAFLIAKLLYKKVPRTQVPKVIGDYAVQYLGYIMKLPSF